MRLLKIHSTSYSLAIELQKMLILFCLIFNTVWHKKTSDFDFDKNKMVETNLTCGRL